MVSRPLHTHGSTAIRDGSMVTVREAARRLGKHWLYVRGAADVMGITLYRASNSLVMSEGDFDRLRRHFEATAPEAATAS